MSSKTCIKATDNINKKGLEASYMVCYRVARTGKPHTIVEDFFIPAAADMAGTMLGEKPKNTIQTMPSSNNTVSRHISDMAGDVFETITASHTSEFYALQLDESTDVAGLVQTWRAWYMSVTFMGGQLRKTSSSANHWKPGYF